MFPFFANQLGCLRNKIIFFVHYKRSVLTVKSRNKYKRSLVDLASELMLITWNIYNEKHKYVSWLKIHFCNFERQQVESSESCKKYKKEIGPYMNTVNV